MSQNEIIIAALHIDKEYSEAFRDKFPEIFPELLSYTLNKDCSCATRIHEFVKENFDRVNQFYEGFFKISEPTDDTTPSWWSPAGLNRGSIDPLKAPKAKFEEAPDPITDKYMKELSEKIDRKPIFTPYVTPVPRDAKLVVEIEQEEVADFKEAHAAYLENHKDDPVEKISKEEQEKFDKMTDVLSALGEPEQTLDMYGKVVEIGASPDEYTEMMSFGRDNNWAYNGINMMETEKFDEDKGTREPIWLAFFY